MDFLPPELNVTKTRQVQIIRKNLHCPNKYDKMYYFFIFDISKPNGIVDRFTVAREDPVDDELLQQYGFYTERPNVKYDSIATWINYIYYNRFIDGEILKVIQFEIEDVNQDGSPEYKTFISRQ